MAKSVAGGPSSAAGAFVEADKKAAGFSGTLKRVGEVAAGVLAANALQAGARRFVGFIQSGVTAASALGESVNAVGKTFGANSKQIEEFGKTAAETVGLSQRAFNQAAVPLGAMLKNTGMAMDEVTAQTIKLTQRAADMGSVFDTDVSEVLQAIQAGLRGEADPLERFGVQLSAVAIEAEALAMSGKKVASELTAQEKAAARLEVIYKQTATTAGDFADTSDSLANAQRTMRGNIEDAKAAIATAYLPVMAKAAMITGDLATRFVALPTGVRGTTIAIVGLGAALALTVPRIAATKEGLVSMGLAGAGARVSLLRLGLAAGLAGAAVGAMKIAEQVPLFREWGDSLDNAAVKMGILEQEAADSKTTFETVWGEGGWVDHAIADGKDYTYTLAKIAKDQKDLGTETKTAAKVIDQATSDIATSWTETFTEFDVLQEAHESALDKLSGKTKLTASEYIAELRNMVAEQETWAANMISLARRIPPEMLEELRKLGPQGAAQVALLNSMSDKELRKVVALYLRAGTLSAEQFAAGITGSLGAIEAAASKARVAASRGLQQQHQTGGFAHGGISGAAAGGPQGGMKWVGEAGPELVKLPYGSMVYPAGQSAAMANGGGGGGTTMLAFAPGAADDITRLLVHIIQKYVRDAGGNGAALGIRTVG